MADDGLRALVLDLLEPLGFVRHRRLFSGTGFFRHDLMFAMLIGGTLYFRVDDASRPDFETRGMTPFEYGTRQREVSVRSYWRVPEELFDEPDTFARWALRAYDAARAARADKPVRPRNRRPVQRP